MRPLAHSPSAAKLTSLAREFRIDCGQRHALRLGTLLRRDLEESLGEGRFRVGPGQNHRKELVVLELVVHIEPEQDDEELALLDDDWHRRRRHVGRIAMADRSRQSG
jgi:hypothetical protein